MAAKKKPAKVSKKQKKAKKAVKKAVAKPAAKSKKAGKPARRAAKSRVARPIVARRAAAPARSKRKSSWLDEQSHKPTIERYARQLRSFMKAMEDGRIDQSELDEQEQRLVGLMQEIEPQLDDALHARVTELLCELTAYDLMQTLHSINASRPKPVFQG